LLHPKHFGRILDLLERSGIHQVRLLGGEPSLHPDFVRIVDQAVDRGFTIMVFSNGLMPESSLRALANLRIEQCGVVLNVRCPSDDTPDDREFLYRTCQRLGQRASVGVNIYRPGLSLSFVLELIDRFGLGRSIRLGLAHPRLGADNDFLHPRFYHLVGQELLQLARQAQQLGIELDPDCGFVPCMFPGEFFDVTGFDAGQLGRRCGPIPDILPDLSSIHCYALGNLERYPISGARTTSKLIRLYTERRADARHLGVYRECSTCSLRQDRQCYGGCLAASMGRLRGRRELVRANSRQVEAKGGARSRRPVASAPHRWMLPYVDQPVEFWQELAATYPSSIKGVYFPLPVSGLGSGRPPQPAQHLEPFLNQDAVGKHVLINPIMLPEPVTEMGAQITDQLERLAQEHGISGATICDLRLAEMARQRLPGLELTASVLADVCEPHQLSLLEGLFDVIVPSTRILRSSRNLIALREAFSGRLRLLVNEACLPGCPYRRQHFYEMATSENPPESLCAELLERQPWLRIIGAWVLPQHLHWFDELADEYKLAGRVTLRDPDNYRRVCDAYIHRTALWPNEIGGGPASILDKTIVPDDLYETTLACDRQCHQCDLCQRFARRDVARRAAGAIACDAPEANSKVLS
jgi:hypothetical protein